MRNLYLLLCFLLGSNVIIAQEFHITGKVMDAANKQALEASTIYAESLKDSSLISYTITGKTGDFDLAFNTQEPRVKLYVSYNGYQPQSRSLTLDQRTLALGDFLLEIQAEQLEGVDVVGERVPIQIKKDTLEFNANSFKTRPDASVEDVLKKLPGVQVDLNGNITVNGKPVNRVLVNGQVFFDSDPKVATRSLPKDVIEKIQITDTKTRTEEFTGDQADGENKTINLTVKKDRNKGVFGRMAAGYGTDDRYQASGLLNYFNNTQRFSVLAASNNVNSPGFSTDEVFEAVGGNIRNVRVSGRGTGRGDSFNINGINFGGNQGITTSTNAGASYANAEKDKYELSSNYFYGNSENFNDQRTLRENLLPDNTFFTEDVTSTRGSSNSHRLSGDLEYNLSESFQISVRPAMTVNNTKTFNENTTRSFDEQQVTANENQTTNWSNGENRNYNNRVDFFKRLDTLGQFVRLTISNDNSTTVNLGRQNSRREVFGTDPSLVLLNQETTVNNAEDQYGIELDYRFPLSKALRLEFEYNYELNEQKNIREVFDFDENTGGYTSFNTLQSSDFEFRNIRQSPSLGISYRKNRNFISLEGVFQRNDLRNEDFLQGISFSKAYENFLLQFRAGLGVGKNTRIFMGYFPNINVPSVGQLQPIPDVSNPLNIVVGNPNLDPELTHRFNLNFNNYDWKSGQGFFIYAGGSYSEDQVVALTTTDENFLRTTAFTNVDGAYNFGVGIGYNKQLKKKDNYTLSLRLDPNYSISKVINFSNGVQLETETSAPGIRASTTFSWNEMMEIEPQYSFRYNDTRYSLDRFEDVNFVTHNAGLRTTTYWPENIIWGNDITYTYNGNVSESFDKDALFWNMTLGVELFKKQASLKVMAYDLLNQNINTQRTTGVDFVQDSQGTVLTQYFMVTMTWKFDQFGGKRPGNSGRMRYYRR
ncbi:TonB-dependent receptor [Robertkochia marina]|uniref:TonB-dependent receptor n=1 Tax=Robertkochia marina TaxID=1227945 RepID=A0A4S3M125_9FLAO|nr:outer membrane beta-barrel protein [Robertkochia marina]THD68774.1 TonB-dependent receptor [Robertkochia marina]TRZ43847.1 TonB-dependent receptor [Robertkochia marina]